MCNPQLALLTRTVTFEDLTNVNVPSVWLPKVRARLALALDIATIPVGSAARASFVESFASDVGTRLGVSASRIVVNSIASGSVIVDFSILPDSSGHEISLSVVSTAFSAGGVAIAGSTTTTAVEITASAGATVDAVADEHHGVVVVVVAVVVGVVLTLLARWGVMRWKAAADSGKTGVKTSSYAESRPVTRGDSGDSATECHAMLGANPLTIPRSRTPP